MSGGIDHHMPFGKATSIIGTRLSSAAELIVRGGASVLAVLPATCSEALSEYIEGALIRSVDSEFF